MERYNLFIMRGTKLTMRLKPASNIFDVIACLQLCYKIQVADTSSSITFDAASTLDPVIFAAVGFGSPVKFSSFSQPLRADNRGTVTSSLSCSLC